MPYYSAEVQQALARVLQVKAAYENDLFEIPGVHSISVQPKTTNGGRTKEFAIVVSVTKKKPTAELEPSEIIPAVIDGVSTDVVEFAPSVVGAGSAPDADDVNYLHVLGGVKIASDGMTKIVSDSIAGPKTLLESAGTLGCVAINQDPAATDPSKKIVGLTNGHVLLEVVRKTTHDGKAVGQPNTSSLCCKSLDNTIGHTDHDAILTGFDPATHPNPPPTGLDAGFVTLDPEVQWAAEVIVSGEGGSITVEQIAGAQPVGLNDALFDMTATPPKPIFAVHKRGFRTKETRGWLVSIHASRLVQYRSLDGNVVKSLKFLNQLEIQPQDATKYFALVGDSGSVILNDSRKVVGLLFTAAREDTDPTTTHVFANPIGDVQTQLKVLVADSSTFPGVQTVPTPGPTPHAFAKLPADRITLRQRMEIARTELGGTELGAQLDTALHRHFHEIRSLVNVNKRAATVWRSIGGPAWIGEVFNCLLDHGRQFPTELEGRGLSNCFDQMAAVLRRYGSRGLIEDLATFGPELRAMGGRSYDETLALWRGLREAYGE